WYNGQQRFSRTIIFNSPSQDQEFSQQLLADFTFPLVIVFEEKGIAESKLQSFKAIAQSKAMNFSEEYKELSPLYDNLKELLKEKHISIDDVIHRQSHELYHFARQEEKAVIQFYYNAQNHFTQATNLKNKCNSNA